MLVAELRGEAVELFTIENKSAKVLGSDLSSGFS